MKKQLLIVLTLASSISFTNAQWQQTNNGQVIGNCFISCLAVSGTNIFAGGEDGTGGVYLSSDSGASWTAVNNGLPYYAYVTAIAVSGTNIFAGINNYGLYKSTNNGASWTMVKSTDVVHSLAVSGTNIFMAANSLTSGGVFLTNNNGGSWTEVNNDLSWDTGAVALAVNGTNIFVAASAPPKTNYIVFSSTDAGASWTPMWNGLPTKVSLLAALGTNIFAAATPGYTNNNGIGVYLSTDSGGSWTAVNNGLMTDTTWVYSFAEVGKNIFAATPGGVFLSTNNGANWTAINNGLTDSTIVSLAVCGTNLFAGDNSGFVWKRSLSDIFAGVGNISANYTDFTIYPNPATNLLTIHSSSFHNEAVTVSVMNVLGQVMHQEQLKWGSDVSMNISNLAAGIYFLQMKTESGSAASRFVKE